MRLCFLILVNDQIEAQFFFRICLFQISLHVSSTYVIIIRRINYINMTSGIYTTLCKWPSGMRTCILEGHLHRVTYTRYRIDKINSPDDEHMSARNM